MNCHESAFSNKNTRRIEDPVLNQSGIRPLQRFCHFRRTGGGGLSLLEIVIAMLILAMAVFPLIRSFTQNHQLAVRQLDQEIALKIAEAALNSAMSGHFEILDSGSAFANANLPLRLELPNQAPINGSITLGGPGQGKTTGGTTFRVGATTFNVKIDCDPLFGLSPTTTPLELVYRNVEGMVASYACPPEERIIRIKSGVSWEANHVLQNITLESCRAKLSK